MRVFAFILWCLLVPCYAQISIVAAENFYGSVAQELGGPYVQVTNILSSPIVDPHLFSPKLSQAKIVADADIVVYNGAGYDGWMAKLLAASPNPHRHVLVVADLIPNQTSNPHIWYAPETMPAYAQHLTALLKTKDPAHAVYFQTQLTQFLKHYQGLTSKINILKIKFSGRKILTTEPLFDDMAHALSLTILGHPFALSVMNETSPAPVQVQSFTDHLSQKQADVLIFNQQVSSPLIEHMKTLAHASGIPMVGVYELQPLKMSYIEWMMHTLNELDEALNDQSHH